MYIKIAIEEYSFFVSYMVDLDTEDSFNRL